MNSNTYSFLGAAAPTTEIPSGAADANVVNHILTVLGLPAVDVRLIESFTPQDTIPEQPAVTTVTPATPTAGQRFAILIEQFNSVTGGTQKAILDYVVQAGDVAVTICDAWKAQLAIFTGVKGTTNATGAGTFAFTSSAGFARHIISKLAVGAGITVTPTTLAIAPANTFNTLATLGLTGQVSGQTYFSYEMVYRDPSKADSAGNVSMGRRKHTLYIYKLATNYAAYAARLVQIKAGVPAAGTVADPAFIGL